MGNFICALSLLVFMILFVIVNSFIICNLCDEIIFLADNGQFDEAKALWKEKKGYISFFTDDKEIDAVDYEAKQSESGFSDAVLEIKNGNVLNWQGVF